MHRRQGAREPKGRDRNVRRQLIRPASTLATIVATLVLTAGPALALSPAPDQTWRIHGKTFALAKKNNTIYVGGRFGKVLSPDGSTSEKVGSLAAFDMSTGKWIPSFAPRVTNTVAVGPAEVRALALSADGSTIYLGGKFDTVDGQPRENVAAVDASTGALVSPFDVSVNHAVNAILVGADRVYLGGDFSRVNNKPRANLAAITPGGALNGAWQPSADSTVRSLTFASNGDSIFVSGKFTTMNGGPRNSVARVSSVDGSLDAWAIPAGVVDAGIMAWDSIATPTRLFVALGSSQNYLAVFQLDDGATGTQVWRLGLPGNVQALALAADGLFVGGHFGTAIGDKQVCGGTLLAGLVLVDPATGDIDCSWIPQIEPNVANYTAAWALLNTPTQLWVAGYFTSISGVVQEGIARYTLGDGPPRPVDSDGDGVPDKEDKCPASPGSGTDGCTPTSLSLKIRLLKHEIRARGVLSPSHSRDRVQVSLFRKRSGPWTEVRTRWATLNRASRYRETFKRSPTRQCRVIVHFPRDEDHGPSKARLKFDC